MKKYKRGGPSQGWRRIQGLFHRCARRVTCRLRSSASLRAGPPQEASISRPDFYAIPVLFAEKKKPSPVLTGAFPPGRPSRASAQAAEGGVDRRPPPPALPVVSSDLGKERSRFRRSFLEAGATALSPCRSTILVRKGSHRTACRSGEAAAEHPQTENLCQPSGPGDEAI